MDTFAKWASLAATVVTVVGGVLLISEQNHKRRERKKARSVQWMKLSDRRSERCQS
ncbi:MULTISPECIES: hypothetical protein [unclassified Streptomyces]|uniref:hypothetical protein n=1 Tax=unclassified Streptomyces TaxID=2593676 RepID=UPI00342E48C6